jgi:hypothetical protein
MAFEIDGQRFDIKIEPATLVSGIGGFEIVSGSFSIPAGTASFSSELEVVEGKVIIAASWVVETSGWGDVEVFGARPDGLAGRRWTILCRNNSTVSAHGIGYFLSVADA